MFKISYTVLFKGSVEIGMFVDREKLEILFRVGYILAVAVMLVPLVRDKEWEGKYFILSFCMPVIAIIWFAITFFSGFSKINSNDTNISIIMEAADVSVKLTKSGWAFLLVSVGSIFLTAKTRSELINQQDYLYLQQKKEDTPAWGIASIAGNMPTWKTGNIPTWKKTEMVEKGQAAWVDRNQQSIQCPKCLTRQNPKSLKCSECGMVFFEK